MLDDLSISWKMVGCAFAIFFILSAFRRKQQATSDKTVVLQRSSLAGRAGGAIMAHAVLSTISGVLGFPVVAALFSIVCAVPLMLMGAEVHLPEFVKAWPRSIVAKIKGTFIDAKEGIKGKMHDGKEAVVRRFKGEQDAPEDSDALDVSPDSDEFWGGESNSNTTPEMRGEEILAFDARPPEEKIAIFESAKPLERALPKSMPDLYSPVQWYTIRVGRSTDMYMTENQIAMYAMMWSADQNHTHGMDARIRAHFTRISKPPLPLPFAQCRENFNRRPAAERFAAFDAALKLMWPLPKQFDLPEGHSRDEQFYNLRVCPCWGQLYTRDDWKKARDDAFEEMQAAEIAAAEPKAARLARAAREKAAAIVHNVKGRASQKARDVAANVKAKSTHLARDLKDKAEEGVKEGAKGLFWKALGY